MNAAQLGQLAATTKLAHEPGTQALPLSDQAQFDIDDRIIREQDRGIKAPTDGDAHSGPSPAAFAYGYSTNPGQPAQGMHNHGVWQGVKNWAWRSTRPVVNLTRLAGTGAAEGAGLLGRAYDKMRGNSGTRSALVENETRKALGSAWDDMLTSSFGKVDRPYLGSAEESLPSGYEQARDRLQNLSGVTDTTRKITGGANLASDISGEILAGPVGMGGAIAKPVSLLTRAGIPGVSRFVEALNNVVGSGKGQFIMGAYPAWQRFWDNLADRNVTGYYASSLANAKTPAEQNRILGHVKDEYPGMYAGLQRSAQPQAAPAAQVAQLDQQIAQKFPGDPTTGQVHPAMQWWSGLSAGQKAGMASAFGVGLLGVLYAMFG